MQHLLFNGVGNPSWAETADPAIQDDDAIKIVFSR